MKIKEERVIPAQMEKVVYEDVTVCDICGKGADRKPYRAGGAVCVLCGRDICKAHKIRDPDELGDYPDMYCSICSNFLHEEHFDEFRMLEEEYDQKVQSLRDKIKEKSLAQKNE